MATETNDTSTDAQDEQQDAPEEEQTNGDSGEKSQEEMAAEFEERKRKQYAESKKKIGMYQMAATVLLVVIALCCFYFSQSVTGDHPLVQQVLAGLGVANLVGALVMQVRKNFSRTAILILMPLTILAIGLTFTNTMAISLLVCVLCVAEIYLMFRQPVLDEYDAPKE